MEVDMESRWIAQSLAECHADAFIRILMRPMVLVRPKALYSASACNRGLTRGWLRSGRADGAGSGGLF